MPPPISRTFGTRTDAWGQRLRSGALVLGPLPGRGWQKLAWWIHDHLSYSSLFFFPTYWAFNFSWHERPIRRIDSYVAPKGCLTRPGMGNHDGSHEQAWRDFVASGLLVE